MPRYFFDLRQQSWNPDDIGTELSDDRAAIREARLSMAEFTKDLVAGDGLGAELVMAVRRANGDIIVELTVTFSTTLDGNELGLSVRNRTELGRRAPRS